MKDKEIFKELYELIGQSAETNQKVGDFPKGHQVIIHKILDPWCDPLIKVEQRGRFGTVHLSEINLLNTRF